MNAFIANEDRGKYSFWKCEETRKCSKLRYELVADVATNSSAVHHRLIVSAEARASRAHGTRDYDNSVLSVAQRASVTSTNGTSIIVTHFQKASCVAIFLPSIVLRRICGWFHVALFKSNSYIVIIYEYHH